MGWRPHSELSKVSRVLRWSRQGALLLERASAEVLGSGKAVGQARLGHVVIFAGVPGLYQFINFRNIERSATQALLPGPTAWMLPTCLKDAAYFHFPVALVDLFAISLAAKVRVVRFDNVAQGGLLVHSRAARLQLRFSEGCTIGHMLWCQGWGKCSFFHHLADADNQFSSRLQAGQAMGANASRRENFQHQITPLFRTTGVGSATVHFRRRLDRWTTLLTLPGCRVTKVRRVLEVLGRRTSPKVQAAYLRTFCDGWCTRRRFQGDAQCAFGCGAGFDGLEHYARCTHGSWAAICFQL